MKNVIKKAHAPLSYAIEHSHGILRFRVVFLTLALLLTAVLSVILMLIVPVSGVRSDVIITFDDQKNIEGTYASYISENTTLVAKSALRARDVRQTTLFESTSGTGSAPQPQNSASVHGVGNGFSISTYGGDLITIAKENRLALNDVLRAQAVHYGADSGVRFNVVGNAYEVPNYKLIGLLSLFCLIFSTLFVYVLTRFLFSSDSLQGNQGEQENFRRTTDNIPSEAPTPTSAYVSDVSFDPGDMSRQFNEVGEESLFSPSGSDDQGQYDHMDYEKPHPQNFEQVRPPAATSTHKSNLAQSWGDMGVRERLSSLQESFTPSSKKQQDEDVTQNAVENAKNAENIAQSTVQDIEMSVPDKPTPHVHLRDLEGPFGNAANTDNASSADDTADTMQTGDAHALAQEFVAQSQVKKPQLVQQVLEQPQRPEQPVDFFGQSKQQSKQSTPVGVPGNLPVVDISDNFPDVQGEIDGSQAQPAAPEFVSEVPEMTQQHEIPQSEFIFDDSLDETDHQISQQIEQTVTDLGIDVPEPTDQELRDRLNRLLRGEM